MNKLLLDIRSHIETERLYLRPYRPGDGSWYFPMSLRNKAHLGRFESGNPIRTITTEEEAEEVVRSFAAQWLTRTNFFLAAFEKSSREFAGQIYIGGVNWSLPEFEVGYFGDVDHGGCGYITEAVNGALEFIFHDLKAVRVRLECDDTNERSYKVAERCGMVKEGHFRSNKRNPDETLSGTLWYGLLRSEFEASMKLK